MPTVSSATTVLCLGSTGIARPTQRRTQDGERHVQHPGQEHGQAVVHAGDDPLALDDGLGQRRERVLEQDDVRDRASRLAAALHRDAQLRLLERQDVVDAVADHGDPLAVLAQRADQACLERRRHAPEHRPRPDRLGQLGVVHRLQLQARDGLAVQAQPDLAGERGHGHRVVARDELQGHARIGEAGQGGACVRAGSAPGARARPSAPGRRGSVAWSSASNRDALAPRAAARTARPAGPGRPSRRPAGPSPHGRRPRARGAGQGPPAPPARGLRRGRRH